MTNDSDSHSHPRTPTKEEVHLAEVADRLAHITRMIPIYVGAWIRDPRRTDPHHVREAVTKTLEATREVIDALEKAEGRKIIVGA